MSLADERDSEEIATKIKLVETLSRQMTDQFQVALEIAPLELVH